MSPLRIGLVGYGGFGRFLHAAWRTMPGVTVSVVASPGVMEAGGALVVPDWRELVGRPDIDLVAVATPPATHAEIGIAALEAGHDLLVEKPVATSLADADRLIAARDARGRVAAVDFLIRFTPIVEALAGWARSGAFGPLVRVAVENEAQDASLGADHWFWDRTASGGILVEHAVHFLDLVNALVEAGGGHPDAAHVSGVARRRADGREDRVLATVVHADGPVATHAHAFTRPAAFERTTIRLSFALADVDLDGWIPLAGRVRALVGAGTEVRLADLPGLRVVSDQPLGAEAVVGGTRYAADRLVEATFAVPDDKPTVYADALRAVVDDLRHARETPGHRLRTPLDAGRRALAQALAAREAADRVREVATS